MNAIRVRTPPVTCMAIDLLEPLVSVVIPTYNRAYCLRRTLESVFAQTHRRLEVLLVDDGSTDGTAALAEEIGRNEPRLRYLRQANAGVCAARNLGLETARGEYIALLDSDDVWFDWKIAAQVAVLAADRSLGMVWTDMKAVDPLGHVTHDRYLRTMYSAYRWIGERAVFDRTTRLGDLPGAPCNSGIADVSVRSGDLYSAMIMGNLVHTSTVLLTRERLRKVGLFDVQLRMSGEDYDFHLRSCREGRVALLDVPSILYQRGAPDQLTRPDLAYFRATNFLATIEKALRDDMGRIRLPKRMIDAVFAEGHLWIGEVELELGHQASARRHLSRSLLRDPSQGRAWRLAVLSMLPAATFKRVRSFYRSARGSL